MSAFQKQWLNGALYIKEIASVFAFIEFVLPLHNGAFFSSLPTGKYQADKKEW